MMVNVSHLIVNVLLAPSPPRIFGMPQRTPNISTKHDSFNTPDNCSFSYNITVRNHFIKYILIFDRKTFIIYYLLLFLLFQ